MSDSQVLAFIEKLSVDPVLRQKVSMATKSAQVIRIATDEGFKFTIDEFRAVAATLPSRTNDELNEQELEAVVGGIDTSGMLPFYHAALGYGAIEADINWISHLP